MNKLSSRTNTSSQKWSLLVLVLLDSWPWSRAGPEVLGLGLILLGCTPFPCLLGRTKTKTSSQKVTLSLALGLCVNNLGLGFEHIPSPLLGWDQDQDSLPKRWLCCPQSPNWRPPLLSSHPQLPDLGRLSHFIGIFKTG